MEVLPAGGWQESKTVLLAQGVVLVLTSLKLGQTPFSGGVAVTLLLRVEFLLLLLVVLDAVWQTGAPAVF